MCRRLTRPVSAAAACLGAILSGVPAGAASASENRPEPRTPAARTADAAGAARALEARLNAIRGLTARFTQTLESAALPSSQVEDGVVYLLRPGRMRWEYSDPPGKLAVADGERSWLYLPEDRQVLVAPIPDASNDQGIGLLLRDRLDLLAEFETEWGPSAGPGDRRALVLRPRSRQASFDRLAVVMDGTGFPVRLTVLDPLGGSVTYRFTEMRFADRLDESLFRFIPPPGMSVQELTP